jgi:hypothetical protein
MIVLAVAGVSVAAFAWYLWANVCGLADLRRREAPIVEALRVYAPPPVAKPLDTTARALIRELRAATPTT